MSNSEPNVGAAAAAPDLTPALSGFVTAVNLRDFDRLVACFTEYAVVNDQLVEHNGRDGIGRWVVDDVFADRLSLQVVAARKHAVTQVMIAKVDGDFDKRGLPDPLLLTFYVAMDGDQIAQMIILRVQSC